MAIINSVQRPENSHAVNYVTIENFEGKRFDVSQIMRTIIIYEDLMETGYHHGTLTIQDDNGLHMNLPLNGQEWLEVSFQTRIDGGDLGTPELKKRYKITSIKDLVKQKDNENQIIMLGFVSEALWKSEQNLISKSYKQSLTSDIVRDLFDNCLEVAVDVEDTIYPRDWIIPNITALDFAYRLTDQSTSKDNLSSDFRLYENISGWNFKSLYTLSTQDFSHRINYNIDNISDFDRLQASIYKKDTHFDMQSQLLGGLNNAIDELDTLEKRVIRSGINYSEYRKEFPTMNSQPLYLGELDFPTVVNYKLVSGNQSYRSNRDSNISQPLKRITQRALYDASVCTVKIPGNIDVQLGQTVYFDFSFLGELDQTTSGKYLICKIKHDISPQEYTMTINIRKDSNIEGDKVEK